MFFCPKLWRMATPRAFNTKHSILKIKQAFMDVFTTALLFLGTLYNA